MLQPSNEQQESRRYHLLALVHAPVRPDSEHRPFLTKSQQAPHDEHPIPGSAVHNPFTLKKLALLHRLARARKLRQFTPPGQREERAARPGVRRIVRQRPLPG